jgi:hypothetical protein
VCEWERLASSHDCEIGRLVCRTAVLASWLSLRAVHFVGATVLEEANADDVRINLARDKDGSSNVWAEADLSQLFQLAGCLKLSNGLLRRLALRVLWLRKWAEVEDRRVLDATMRESGSVSFIYQSIHTLGTTSKIGAAGTRKKWRPVGAERWSLVP